METGKIEYTRQLSLEAAAAAANQESAEDAERDAAQRKTQRIMSQETSALGGAQ